MQPEQPGRGTVKGHVWTFMITQAIVKCSCYLRTPCLRLVKIMFTDGKAEWLGMKPEKKPPEMSMYLSVLLNTGIHHQHGESWRIPANAKQQRCSWKQASGLELDSRTLAGAAHCNGFIKEGRCLSAMAAS